MIAMFIKTQRFSLFLSLFLTICTFIPVNGYNQLNIESQTFLDLLTDNAHKAAQNLQYWQTELLQTELSFYQRNLNHIILPKKYKSFVQKKIINLKRIEEQIYTLIGKILLSQNMNIVEQCNLYQCTTNNTQTVESNKTESQILQHLLEEFLKIDQALRLTQIPPHYTQYKKWYFAAAITAISSYFYYSHNKERCNSLMNNAKSAGQYNVQKYIKTPLLDLKNLIWNQKTMQMHPLKFDTKLQPQNSWKTWMVDYRLNEYTEMVNHIMDEAITWINQNTDKIFNQFIARQELTMAMIATIPTCLLLYGTSKSAYNGYKHFIKHENWHPEMKNIIFEIDKLLNKNITTNTASTPFEYTGRLYVLISKLKPLITCLPINDQLKLKDDLQELENQNVTTAQKYNTVQRMYQFYDFLKK